VVGLTKAGKEEVHAVISRFPAKEEASSSKLWLVVCWRNRHLHSRQSPPAGITVGKTHKASACPGVSMEIKQSRCFYFFYTFLFQLNIISAQ